MSIDWTEDEYLLLYIQQQDPGERWACYLSAPPVALAPLLETRRRMRTPSLRDLAHARLRMARRQWLSQSLHDSQRASQPLVGDLRADQLGYLRPLGKLAAISQNLASEPQTALYRTLQPGLRQAMIDQMEWLSCTRVVSSALCRRLGRRFSELQEWLVNSPHNAATWLLRQTLGDLDILAELVCLSPLVQPAAALKFTPAQRASCYRALPPHIAERVRLNLSNETLWQLTCELRTAARGNPLLLYEREFCERANLPPWLSCREWRERAPADFTRALLGLVFGDPTGLRPFARQPAESPHPPYTRTQMACRELLMRLDPQFTANVLLLLPLPATHRVLSAMFSSPSDGDSAILLREALEWGRWKSLEEVAAAGPDGLAERVGELFAVGAEADAEALELLQQLPLERRCECLRGLSHLRYLQVAGAL